MPTPSASSTSPAASPAPSTSSSATPPPSSATASSSSSPASSTLSTASPTPSSRARPHRPRPVHRLRVRPLHHQRGRRVPRALPLEARGPPHVPREAMEGVPEDGVHRLQLGKDREAEGLVAMDR
ncbi:hypothetical protein MUK42_13567 [Musa troglodytarum]|uniref:Uncharacterized protein n=1 Tax=Musa troglodytarum TaxID=320322 RepID=A0A9E7F300_9LILI|nr:hypothetical protein MUK42_13567 [Musa troglodytarum]